MKFIRTCTINNTTAKVTNIQKAVLDEKCKVDSVYEWVYSEEASFLEVRGYDLNSVDRDFLTYIYLRQSNINEIKKLQS